MRFLIFPLLMLLAVQASAQNEAFAILGGTIHTGTGEVIENGALFVNGGKIEYVGPQQSPPQGYEVVQADGRHIYPGLIAMNTTLGLVEIEAVRATRDFAETGALNPNVRSIIAYNTDSRITPTARSNGILLAQIVPQSGIMSGTSSAVKTEAWNWEDAAYTLDEGIHLLWPVRFRNTGWWAQPGEIVKIEDQEEKIRKIRELIAEAAAYAQIEDPETVNLKLASMKGLFTGEKTLYVHVHHVKGILDVLELTEQYNLNTVIVGGYDSHMVAEELAAAGIPVLVSGIHELPERPGEDIYLPYRLPKLLTDAGVTVGISKTGSWDQRNLPFEAGTAAAYGMDKEQALAAITAVPAQMLGISGRTGTLEEGKDANIIISEGDILDMRTSRVLQAWLVGEPVNLDDPQKELLRKYEERYGLEITD